MAETREEQIARVDKLIDMLEKEIMELQHSYITRSDTLSIRLDDLKNQRNELQRIEA